MWAQLAAALKAEKLILMTDVPGVLKDKDDIATKYVELDIRTTRKLVPCLNTPSHRPALNARTLSPQRADESCCSSVPPRHTHA